MTKRPTPKLIVTDHTLLRYLERVRGEDLRALRGALANSLAAQVPHGLPTPSAISLDGFTYRLEGRHVVTVVSGWSPRRNG
ncbi:MAG: hypothetical protein ACU0CO_01290 [Shimia sp.]